MRSLHLVLRRFEEKVLVRLRWWVAIGLLVAGLGGASLWLMATRIWPDTLMVLLFLGLLAVTLGGLTVPIAAYLNYRFGRPGWQEDDPRRLLRQGTWVGLLAALCGWLQKEDALNLTIAAVIAGVFALLEAFFLTRDHT
jgi:hypothetical protein